MFTFLRLYLIDTAMAAISFLRRDLDSVVGSLDRTVGRLDAIVEREQAARAASRTRETALRNKLASEVSLRSASFDTSERAQRVRERIAALLA